MRYLWRSSTAVVRLRDGSYGLCIVFIGVGDYAYRRKNGMYMELLKCLKN